LESEAIKLEVRIWERKWSAGVVGVMASLLRQVAAAEGAGVLGLANCSAGWERRKPKPVPVQCAASCHIEVRGLVICSISNSGSWVGYI
jgi:hypothetical protein